LTQVIKKRRIVLASVLKPVDDTRMFEKIGVSLAGADEAEVTIIGYPSLRPPTHQAIKFQSVPAFSRFSWKRLITPWLLFKKINQVKPELIIINTPELLIVAILNRIFFGRRVVYDVLENYYKNIRYTSAYPAFLGLPLAVMVRIMEVVTAPLIHHFLLAERGYQKELGFANPNSILENKLPKSIALAYANANRGNSTLLFSGTLAASTGVFEAIRLCQQLHTHDTSFSLTIIGYCAVRETLVLIKKEISDCPYIKLIGGDRLIPHQEILTEISHADIGIIIYPTNPSTASSIPTKLYEYLGLRLPVLIRHNPESHQLVNECKAGVILDEAPNYSVLSATLKSTRFTPNPPDSIFWESQTEILINSLK
jgi:glycogen synthase